MRKPWLETGVAFVGILIALYVGEVVVMSREIAFELAFPIAFLGALVWERAYVVHKAGKTGEKKS